MSRNGGAWSYTFGFRWGRISAAAVATVLPLLSGCGGASSIFASRGASSRSITTLGWFMTILSIAVVVIVTGVLVYALFRRRIPPPLGAEGQMEGEASESERRGRLAILWGTVVSIALLLVALVWTLKVLIEYSGGLRQTDLTVHITGYQYWWDLEYLDDSGNRDFLTANELHIPAGSRVRLELEAGDVIHSFWVPELAGKRDLIPGQHNVMWISADEPGLYRGQCAEFCGTSHANMLIRVLAQEPSAYEQWAASQRVPAQPDSTGLAEFQHYGCAACHRIAGTTANGHAGPDLTHVGGRATLASGILPNTRQNMSRWLADPKAVKPGVLMPATGLEGASLSRMVAFLESLR